MKYEGGSLLSSLVQRNVESYGIDIRLLPDIQMVACREQQIQPLAYIAQSQSSSSVICHALGREAAVDTTEDESACLELKRDVDK